jgi:hypothetical protein
VSSGPIPDSRAYHLGSLQTVGQFRLDVREKRWEWSEEMYRLHGFEPGEVVPTTELILRHKQPGEGEVSRAALDEAVATGKPHSYWHHIVDAQGRVRAVVTVWNGVKDETGEVVEVRGYMMDVSNGARQESTEAVAAALEHRGVIDQAKGMLMLIHGLTADAAFDLLKGASCQTNTKLYVLAQRLVDALAPEGVGPRRNGLAQRAGEVLAGQEAPDAPSQQAGA